MNCSETVFTSFIELMDPIAVDKTDNYEMTDLHNSMLNYECV